MSKFDDQYQMKEGESPDFEYQGTDGANWIARIVELDVTDGPLNDITNGDWLIKQFGGRETKYEWIYFKDGGDQSSIQMKIESRFIKDISGGSDLITSKFNFRRHDGGDQWSGDVVIILDRDGQKWSVAVNKMKFWPAHPTFTLKKV